MNRINKEMRRHSGLLIVWLCASMLFAQRNVNYDEEKVPAYTLPELLLSTACGSVSTGSLNNQKQEEPAPFYFSFDKGANETVRVYVQVHDSLYAMFRVAHEVNVNHFKNLWRIKTSHMCEYTDGRMKELYPILTAGENEFVWYSAREGVKEATGGYHGNERIDVGSYGGVQFFADDQLIDLSSNIPLTSCESFYYIQHSTMHETGTGGLIRSSDYIPVPGNPIECYHEKKTVFNNGGYNTYNKLIWAKNETPVKTNNFGLFCVTTEVAKIGYNEAGTQVVFNSNGGNKLMSSGSKITMQNPELNISVTCDAKLIKPTGHTTISRIWDTKVYHKYYHRLGGQGEIYPTVEGEEWQSESSIHFSRIE